jgi:hypothetical protein
MDRQLLPSFSAIADFGKAGRRHSVERQPGRISTVVASEERHGDRP